VPLPPLCINHLQTTKSSLTTAVDLGDMGPWLTVLIEPDNYL
jgi:hypothetical protein